MRTLKIVLATLLISLLILGAAVAGVVYSGAYNIAATEKHWPVTKWLLHETMEHSVAQRAASLDVPPLGDDDQILTGVANYAAMCSGCHAPPGAEPSVAARGMYPEPPDLTAVGADMPPNQIFWVIKHGIKASGMPAWGVTHGDDDMWAMTALIKQFPDMSGGDYEQLVQTAQASGVGHHGGEGHHGGGSHSEDEGDHTAQEGGHSEGDAHGDTAASGEAGHHESGAAAEQAGEPGHHDSGSNAKDSGGTGHHDSEPIAGAAGESGHDDSASHHDDTPHDH